MIDKDKEYRKRRRIERPWMMHLDLSKSRCNNPNHMKYKSYGERGIKCLLTEEEIKTLWYRDKASDLVKPSIDRKDPDGNYVFDNCQFIEHSENSRKHRRKWEYLAQTTKKGKG